VVRSRAEQGVLTPRPASRARRRAGDRPVDVARLASRHLAASDPVLARVIERVGACTLAPRRGRDHNGSLARSNVTQHL
jgi:hypothetical protein